MSLTIDQVKEVTAHNESVWNRCAPTYVEVFEPLTGGATTTLLDLAGVGRATVLLDIGTGPGTLIGPALQRGAHVVAIDLAPEMVATARSRHPRVDIAVGDATTMPFADASHDAITLGFCLHHAADPDGVLREANRVLRPGGRIAFTVWAPADQLEAFGVAFAAVAESVPMEDPSSTPQPPILGTEPADYETVLTRAGFSHPTARILDLTWPVTDGATIFDGFDRFLDLSGQTPEVRAQIRQRLDELVRAKTGPDGVARLRNPAIIAAATKT
jgi:SAM-dependent methyltransferase